jgi:endonuclease G, mitochondrial
MLISIDLLDESEKKYNAIKSVKSKDTYKVLASKSFIGDESSLTKGNLLGDEENMKMRKSLLKTSSLEPEEFAFERAIGKNDSVYSNFVELIHHAKSKVGRIVIKKGIKQKGFATGFMVSENLLLTNWHVFKTIEDVADSEVQFNYEYNTEGNAKVPISFKLKSAVFYHSNKDLDYCFVAVDNMDIDGRQSLRNIGYLFLDPVKGKLGNEDEEKLNIIHHPDGDLKQLSIRENKFKKITPNSIWYETDTAPGSSGSPVFNDQWQVVALHHMGIGKKNSKGQYIDKMNQAIPLIDGNIDASKIIWEANEGIRISVILNDIFTRFKNNNLIKGLKNPPVSIDIQEKINVPTLNPVGLDQNKIKTRLDQANNDDNIMFSFPSSLLEKTGNFNFSINQGTNDGNDKPPVFHPFEIPQNSEELDAEEIKKIEVSIDFSECNGYQSKFLGSKHTIPLPQPQAAIKKHLAKADSGNSTELKYFNYSVLYHASRKLPLISAVNVDGDDAVRLDHTKRKDNWLRDNRLDFDIQLDDKYYTNSGFDRGHMSRREDANWGSSADEAKRNADLTCMFTNACPQVPQLNQSSRKGLWGRLEKIILETGAKAEIGKTAKITVFNGPILKNDDPFFRNIQIPVEFFKIVLWLTDKDTLKATAFKLSQINQLNITEEEQLDVDQNIEFKEFQCSIASLQKITKIDFSKIIPFDTFKGKSNKDLIINTEQEVEAMIKR